MDMATLGLIIMASLVVYPIFEYSVHKEEQLRKRMDRELGRPPT